MRILITNDDGIAATGLVDLAAACVAHGHQVWVVAPREQRSSCGHSMTFERPIEVRQVRPTWWAVDGFPADCVLWAINYLQKKVLPKNQKFDLLLSGINRGGNLAQDLYCSGTVAAAREGMQGGIPSVALSLALSFDHLFADRRPSSRRLPPIKPPEYFADAAQWCAAWFATYFKKKDFKDCFLNLNFPNCPATQYQGVQIVRPGWIDYDKGITPCRPMRQRQFFWIGGTQCWPHDRAGTDVHAVKNHFIAASWVKLECTLAEKPLKGRFPPSGHWPRIKAK